MAGILLPLKQMSKINWNADIEFPTDSCFTNRIVSAKFGNSNAGNQMITIEAEVVDPATYMVGEQEVNIAGVKTKSYYTTKVIVDGVVDEEKTANAQKRVFVSDSPDQPSLWERLGLDGAAEDKDNPNVKQLVGLKILTQMSSEPQEQRKTPTADEIAKAKAARTRPLGAIMKHPKTGKPLVKYWPKIDEIFGVAD